MLNRLTRAPIKRHKGVEREEGFTLIELLVVVIIIGILAAIAIPIYLGVQNNAKDSAVKSDLTNVKTAVVAHFTNNNGTYTALTTAALSGDGFSGYSVAYTGTGAPAWDTTPAPAQPTTNSTAFCIVATSPTSKVFYVTDSSGVTSTKPAGCA